MRKIAKKGFISIIIFSILLIAIALPASMALTAMQAGDGPNPVINITGDKTQGGELVFHTVSDPSYQGSWCPGLAKKGTLSIRNTKFDRLVIRNMGIKMSLNQAGKYDLFGDNMKLTIRKGNYPNFTEPPIYEGNLAGFLIQEGSSQYTGENLELVVNGKNSVDLEYTIAMDEEAGNEMQGLQAQLSILFNFVGIDKGTGPDPENGNNNGNSTTPGPAFLPEPDNWYDDCIAALIAHEIIIPSIDGEVRPNQLITRGEAAVLMGRALKLQEDYGKTSYLDTIPQQYLGYINATTKAGVFRGYPLLAEFLPGRVFKAENYISREELLCVLVRAFNIKTDGEVELKFTDKDQISGWALDDIKAGAEKNIIGGYPDGSFKPQQYISRAEAFTVVCRLLGYHNHGSRANGD